MPICQREPKKALLLPFWGKFSALIEKNQRYWIKVRGFRNSIFYFVSALISVVAAFSRFVFAYWVGRLNFMAKGFTIPLSANSREWLLSNFALGKKNYWFCFIADTLSGLFFLIWEYRLHQSFILGKVALALIAGAGIWTITEYLFHRFLYHDLHGIFGDGHRIHHEDPESYVAMPWFMTTLTVFGIWYGLSIQLQVPLFSGMLGGWLLGFVAYSFVHHIHHHWDGRFMWMRKLKAYHRIHHQLPETNFGVTMPFWDMVFGTRHSPKKLRK